MVTITIDCLLPIDLINFAGNYIENTVQLAWSTSPETNALYFNIEHSTDGLNYSIIGTVSASSTTINASDYLFVDDAPQAGDNYYRLQQVDENGDTYYSNVIVVYCQGEDNYYDMTAVYVNGYNNLIIPGIFITNDIVKLHIYDITGRLIYSDNIHVGSGQNYLVADLSSINYNAVVVCMVVTNNTVYATKVYLD